MKPALRYIIILFIVVVAVMLIRIFLVGSYRIAGSMLSSSLNVGDYVLVNRLKLKISHDRNRLMLYRSPLRQDADHPPLFVGRCIGAPGDIIQASDVGFRVNGSLLPNVHTMPSTFRIPKNIKEPLIQTLKTLQIPFRPMKEDSTGIILRMSLCEKELLNRNLSQVVAIEMIDEHSIKFEFIVPSKGKTIDLNETVITVYKEAIAQEAGNDIVFRDGKLFIQDEENSSFTFQNNYFWILSENETEGIDSRHLGVIPQNYIVGSIWYCLYSKVAANRFKRIH